MLWTQKKYKKNNILNPKTFYAFITVDSRCMKINEIEDEKKENERNEWRKEKTFLDCLYIWWHEMKHHSQLDMEDRVQRENEGRRRREGRSRRKGIHLTQKQTRTESKTNNIVFEKREEKSFFYFSSSKTTI